MRQMRRVGIVAVLDHRVLVSVQLLRLAARERKGDICPHQELTAKGLSQRNRR